MKRQTIINDIGAGLTGAALMAAFIFVPPMGREAATASEKATVTASESVTTTLPAWTMLPDRTELVWAPQPNEDEPGWNCMTMGNGICGPGFVPVSQELGDALSEGDEAAMEDRVWEDCLVSEGDTTYIVCPDGFTTTS